MLELVPIGSAAEGPLHDRYRADPATNTFCRPNVPCRKLWHYAHANQQCHSDVFSEYVFGGSVNDLWSKKESPTVRCTKCQLIYKKFSPLTWLRWQRGKISLRSRATNGYAGPSPLRNREQEGSMSRGYVRSSKRECAGLVVGPVASIAEFPYVLRLHPSL